MTTDVHAELPCPPDSSRVGLAAFTILAAVALVLATMNALWPPRALVDATHEAQ